MANLVFSQAFGYKFYFSPLLKSNIDITTLNSGLAGFMNTGTLLANTSTVAKAGTGSTLGIAVGTGQAVTRAAVASNTATLTFAAAHGLSNGSKIVVSGLLSPFAALNGVQTISAVTTSSPFTLSFAITASNVADAAVSSGTVAGTVLALDGTDNPIRLLGLTNAAPTEAEKEEAILTYDNEFKAFETSIATGKSMNWKLEGVTNFTDAAYKLLRICAKESVREGLMIKWARVGPVGYTEATYGYGRFTGFNETPPAGGIVKFSTDIKVYGPYEIDFTA